MRTSAPLRPARRSRTLVPAAVLGLLLTGCAGAGSSAVEDPDTDKISKPQATEPGTAPAEEPAGAVDAAGPECMLGEWDVAPEVVREAALAGLGDLGADAQVDTTGSTWVRFDGSTMTNVYADQLTTITVVSEGQSIVMSVYIDGDVTAPYTATSDEVQIAASDASALTTTITATVDGQPVEVPGVDEAMKQGSDLSGANTYTCDRTTLELVRTGTVAAGFTQVFSRRG